MSTLNTTSFAGQGRTTDTNYLLWVDENGVVNHVKLEAMWQTITDLLKRTAELEEEIECLKAKPTESSNGKKVRPGGSSGNPTKRRGHSKT